MPQIRFEFIVAMTSPEVRDRILNEEFDRAGVANDVFIIAFCGTLVEGVDTKRASMVVIVDPIQSKTNLVQLMGHVQRKPYQTNVPRGTVLQLAFLDTKKYNGASAEIRQLLLRRDVGDPVLHVLAALREFDAFPLHPRGQRKTSLLELA